jgi:uncharacterized protein (TIGR02598 family)
MRLAVQTTMQVKKRNSKEARNPQPVRTTDNILIPKIADRIHARRAGFSLIEIAIALGVISAGMIPLLGLLSVGFSTMKESNAHMKSSIIAQKILGDAQTAPFGSLVANRYYLDMEGQDASPAEATIVADVTVNKGSTNGMIRSLNAARIEVAISGPAMGGTNVYSATVANLGH